MACDLKDILMLICEGKEAEAKAMLHDWFVEKSKNIHKDLCAEDDEIADPDITDDIKADQEEIQAEEYFGEDTI